MQTEARAIAQDVVIMDLFSMPNIEGPPEFITFKGYNYKIWNV
jgi:hypothetical protein